DDSGLGGSGGRNIYYKRSSDGGLSFTTPVKLNGDQRQPLDSVLAVDPAGGIHVAWAGLDNSGVEGLFYSTSSNGGQSFSAPINLAFGTGFAVLPAISADGNGHVLIAFLDLALARVLAARSDDGGASFGTATRVSAAGDMINTFPVSAALDSH